MFKTAHTCSHLFTTVHTSETTLFAQLHFLIFEFSPWEICYFSILDLCLVKLHILAGLIESFPMEYGMCSCHEVNMSIPLGAHPWRSSMENVNFHTFHGFRFPGSRPILQKLHILARLIESFQMTYGPKSCDKDKLSIPVETHLKAQSSEIFLFFPAKKLKERSFFIFWPILVELLIEASEIESFPTIKGLSNSGEEQLLFSPVLGWSQAVLLRQRSFRNYR